ncbi:hypothetical protein [Chitinophaga qingshengii]|uniref:Uncharacterized protein n=1 Tax=Chitinophaga qingshengii TaxID=1569794 RepID=A0ABR7TWV5_9BACT|nr:hypothetical protein [Chitinophaga qingshengii]MBC9934957.1 hypothetical protein [Chitinophaga qingshengii]
MSESNVFLVMLESSKQEQLPVHIYFSCHTVRGIVAQISASVVELRTDDGHRTIILLDKIDAVSAA